MVPLCSTSTEPKYYNLVLFLSAEKFSDAAICTYIKYFVGLKFLLLHDTSLRLVIIFNFDILGFRGQSEMPGMALPAHWVSRASGLGQEGWRVPMRTSPKDLFSPPPPRETPKTQTVQTGSGHRC